MMRKSASVALATALALVMAPAAQAQGCLTPAGLQGAKVRQLDMMMMVGALRCRTGADDFQADYQRFVEHHRSGLGAANRALLGAMTAMLGPVKAIAEVDRLSVKMANRYGIDGASGCRQLATLARDLAASGNPQALPEAAEAMIGEAVIEPACGPRIASSR